MSNATPETFAQRSRFGCVGLVLDLRHDDADMVLATVASLDAKRMVTLARGMAAPFVVLAGQLHRKKAGAFGAAVRDPAALPMAALTAFHRLGECGESTSAWLVVAEPDVTETVLAALAGVTATEGSA